jgi:protein-disulfide isomerase
MQPRDDEDSELTPPVSEERDHILGDGRDASELVEFGDYECPHCAEAHLILQEVLEHFGDDVRFVYRNFPLAQVHPNAQKAAEAAEAAAAQGRFWEMHDALYENQSDLDGPGLMSIAEELGLDVERFVRELEDDTWAPRVREDFMSGVRSGVNGTPTFYIDGQRMDGPWDRDSLIAAIEARTEQKPSAARRAATSRKSHH